MLYTSGSIRQLNRKGKPWQAILKYKGADGKWHQTTKMLPEAKGKKEAKKLMEAWKDEMNKAASESASIERDITVTDMVEQYLDYQYTMGELESSTYDKHLRVLKNMITPYIGNYGFISLQRASVDKWLADLHNENYKSGTILIAFSLLNKVYNYYQSINDIDKNPLNGVKRPRQSSPRTSHLTKEQMEKYLDAVYQDYNPEDKLYAAFFLALYAGLRRQEICGLRWRDIDFENYTISINTAIGYGRGGNYTKGTKNKSSTRKFPMVEQLAIALRERYDAIQPEDNWFVCGEKTNYMKLSKLTVAFQRFRDRHHLVDAYGKPIILHGIRHNIGAQGIASGMDIASLSNMMGHSNYSTTLDIYGDSTTDAKKTATKKLQDLFDNSTDFYKTDLLTKPESMRGSETKETKEEE